MNSFQIAIATSVMAITSVATAEPSAPPSTEGKEFIDEARLLFRVVACEGDAPLPPNIDAQVVEAHCKELRASYQKYRRPYVEMAEQFLGTLKPKGLSKVVVYPFGGGDLLSALTTYPDSAEITTMSLEHAGDPRRLRQIDPTRLGPSLKIIRQISAGLLLQNDSTSENLMKGERGDVPAQLAFFLMGLAIHGYEPASLKYFQLTPDGEPHYFSEKEINEAASKKAGALKASWTPSDFSSVFSNAELRFVPKKDKQGEVRVHRHIAANLSDSSLGKNPSVLSYLQKRGPICAMTKAASYLLWRDDFSTIRNYLLTHMTFMISDSTGIPPPIAEKAGFRQEPYGHFEGSFLNARADYNEAFRKLWSAAPERKLPFRYGYIDSSKRFHMLITTKAIAEH